MKTGFGEVEAAQQRRPTKILKPDLPFSEVLPNHGRADLPVSPNHPPRGLVH